jgi:hypothetical protein
LAFQDLLSKKNLFNWTTEHSAAFQQLKQVFSTMLFLLQFDAAPIVVKTDASNLQFWMFFVNHILIFNNPIPLHIILTSFKD